MERSDDFERLMRLMRGRRSIRRFEARPVSPGHVERLIEAAACAPSAANRQPYRLLEVSDRVTIDAMARAVGQAAARIAASARPDRRADVERYVASFTAFEHAPTVLVAIERGEIDLLAASSPDASDPHAGRERMARDTTASVAAALTQLLLAAHALGLGACWMTGPLVAAAELRALLAVPDGWDLAALVPLGYPAEQPSPPRRRALGRLWQHVPPKRSEP